MDDLLTAEQAARLLHLHVKRVQLLAREGRLPAVRFGRKWLFPRAALLAAHGGGTAAGQDDLPALEISARNRLRGRIVGLTVDGVMAEVRLAIGEQSLVAVITRSSAERLRLQVGDEVLAVVKSTEVMIARERD